MKRSDLLRYKQKIDKQTRVPLIVTYSRHLSDLHKISRDHMPLLHKSPEMQQIFQEPPLIAYRRDRNLNDILVHGKHNKIFKAKNGESDSCPDKNCAICPIMIRGEEATKVRTKPLNPGDHCKTTNVVYGLHCEVCKNIVYVGETERTVGERIKEHLADIKHKRVKGVAIHFNAENEVCPFRKMRDKFLFI